LAAPVALVPDSQAVVGMRMRSEPVQKLLDRQRERAALDGLLGDLRSGRGRALVVRGEAGVGKSALLEYVTGAAADMRVARAAGVESEMELAFAGLHLLCAPLLRAHLLYGEWLRRESRRADARAQLRTAHEMFAAIGMQALAERARRELTAAGETARQRTVQAPDQLTPQEAQIAQLARAGLSNPEIAAQLFLSPRTIEWHLRKVFAKLEISSRLQLQRALPDGGRDMA